MLLTTIPITNSTLRGKLSVGSYSNVFTLSGSSTSTIINLTRVDTTPGVLVFVPNTSVSLHILWSFNANINVGYNHTGIRLVSVWVDSNGVPTITYNTSIGGTFDGLTVQVLLDSKSGKYYLSLSLFGWGGGVTTYGSATVSSLVTVKA